MSISQTNETTEHASSQIAQAIDEALAGGEASSWARLEAACSYTGGAGPKSEPPPSRESLPPIAVEELDGLVSHE